MYKLLTENTKMQYEDVVVYDDGDEMIIRKGWIGHKVKELYGWADWYRYYSKDDFAVVAVLRPIKEK